MSDHERDLMSTEGVEDDFDLDDAEDMAGNRVTGALPRAVLDYVARQIVDDPEAVVVELEEGRRGVTLRLHVAPDDMGRVTPRVRDIKALRELQRTGGLSDLSGLPGLPDMPGMPRGGLD